MTTIKYVSNGDPNRIPEIGSRITLNPNLQFEVTDYGQSEEILYKGKRAYELELIGKYIIPKGTPVAFLEKFLKGETIPTGEVEMPKNFFDKKE